MVVGKTNTQLFCGSNLKLTMCYCIIMLYPILVLKYRITCATNVKKNADKSNYIHDYYLYMRPSADVGMVTL